MILIHDRFLRLSALQAWWPDSPEHAASLLPRAAVVTAMQCAGRVADALRPLAFRWKPFTTLLLDLSRPEHDLWRGIHPRTRQYITQATRLNGRILTNTEPQRAFRLINESIRRKGFRPPISADEWARITIHGDVFLAVHEDRAIAAQVVLVDYPWRARMIFGATADRCEPAARHLIGPLSKHLVWSVCAHYRAAGVRWYDFGGIDVDRASPLYSISRFKLAFGGQPVTEYNLRLAGRPLLRAALRGLLALHRPWRAAVVHS